MEVAEGRDNFEEDRGIAFRIEVLLFVLLLLLALLVIELEGVGVFPKGKL